MENKISISIYEIHCSVGNSFIKTLDWSSIIQGTTRQSDGEVVPKLIGSKPHSTN